MKSWEAHWGSGRRKKMSVSEEEHGRERRMVEARGDDRLTHVCVGDVPHAAIKQM